MSLNKVLVLGTVLMVSAQTANAVTLTKDQKISRAASSALLNSGKSVLNEQGHVLKDQLTQDFLPAGDVGFDMLTGGDPKSAPPSRRVRVNAPCKQVSGNNYKCAFCVSYAEGGQFKIEKLIYNTDIFAEDSDSFFTANVTSDNVQWVDRVFNHDEACTTPD